MNAFLQSPDFLGLSFVVDFENFHDIEYFSVLVRDL